MAKKTTARAATAKKPAPKPSRQPRTSAPAPGWRDLELFDDAKIKVLVERNPYHGARAKRWTYETGMTVAEAIAKGTRRPDVKWDVAKGYIALSGGTRHTGKASAHEEAKGAAAKHAESKAAEAPNAMKALA